MNAVGVTDIGASRSQNQDTISVLKQKVGPLPNLYIVADGLGGHKAGDTASNMAATSICDYIANSPEATRFEDGLDVLVNAITKAGTDIFAAAEADEELKGMGTTATLCTVGTDKAIIAHIGDSRAYSISSEKIIRLTHDHTYVDELLRAGKISEDEARIHPKRHIITRALGTQKDCEVDGIIADLTGVSILLLCSDGLSNMIEDARLMQISNGEGTLEERAKIMIDEANANGGHDNISVILIDVGR